MRVITHANVVSLRFFSTKFYFLRVLTWTSFSSLSEILTSFFSGDTVVTKLGANRAESAVRILQCSPVTNVTFPIHGCTADAINNANLVTVGTSSLGSGVTRSLHHVRVSVLQTCSEPFESFSVNVCVSSACQACCYGKGQGPNRASWTPHVMEHPPCISIVAV